MTTVDIKRLVGFSCYYAFHEQIVLKESIYRNTYFITKLLDMETKTEAV